MSGFTHVDDDNLPKMVDVGDKKVSKRTAIAKVEVHLPKSLQKCFADGDLVTKKGSVFHTAIIAGTMAAKKTHELIPFCHPLNIESCKIKIQLNSESNVDIRCKVSLHHKTGVEMEALTGASVAALTVYDMCKSISQEIRIHNLRLVEKTGGKSDVKEGVDE